MGRQQRRQSERRAQQRARARQGAGAQQARPSSRGQAQKQGLGRVPIAAGIVVIVLAIAGLVFGVTHQSSSNPTATPAPTVVAASSVDGVQCLGSEQLAYHIHQYLELYDHGNRVQVPALVGIPNNGRTASCLYWIHVHPGGTNIIHVESPIKKDFPLGTFFDVWKATSGSTSPPGDAFVKKLESAPSSQVTSFVNGKRWTGSYRSIPLTAHAVIAVEIGQPIVPWKPFTQWAKFGAS